MSLTQASRNSRREEAQASASASAYTSSDEDEESSVLAHLVAMFPGLDHDVIVSVLQAHDGRLQAAVEYLMNSSGGDHAQSIVGGGRGPVDTTLDPARDMVGQFSDDIGGLPEMLPTFLFDQDEGSQSEDDIGPSPCAEPMQEEPGSPLPPQGGPQGLVDEPLPTYEEACKGSEIPQLRFPHMRELSASGQGNSVSLVPNLDQSVNRAEDSKKKKKGKKKVMSKLKTRRNSIKLKYRAVQDKYKSDASGLKSDHQPYQAFVDDDELDQFEDVLTP